MKSVFKICNMHTSEDINKIRRAISNNEGVVACQISKEKGEVSIIYDDYFVTSEVLLQSIEDLGYAVI
ncbi:heavy-metal-associated domain-containing protein [Clostridium sp. CX1]|uniref:Heavy-metal-associated domain-containing protein n=1 Tax=Clostridium tanneri TaxID=3037988 RepID=A0ABU4JW97_9CLOT|nr:MULTISPECIES: heavy-metal-associated domain-containing protein [unclassified Clostridium]MCT8975696.1 heavy-metal-associated domain-containing protein [Clostridium sp. CX1]MDW8802413.1 heavy-metal-associated domain-containing protein [Clostridium sp. A1-XYC3]